MRLDKCAEPRAHPRAVLPAPCVAVVRDLGPGSGCVLQTRTVSRSRLMRESQSNALHSRDTSVLVQFGSHSGNHNPKLPFLSPLAFDVNTCFVKGRDVAYRGSLGIMQGQGWTQLCEDVGQKRGTALALQGPPVFVGR